MFDRIVKDSLLINTKNYMSKVNFYNNLALILLSLFPIVENIDILYYAIFILFIIFFVILIIKNIKLYKSGQFAKVYIRKQFSNTNEILCRFAIIGYGILICYLTNNSLLEVWYCLLAFEILGLFLDKLSPLFEDIHKKKDL